MPDHGRRDDAIDQGAGSDLNRDAGHDASRDPSRDAGHDASRQAGSPLGTDPQQATPLPGDPREAQEPQEPRTTHVGPGRVGEGVDPSYATDTGADASDRTQDMERSYGDPDHDKGNRDGVVDHLRDAWDKMRGKK